MSDIIGIGCGLMGSALVRRLAKDGLTRTIWNRTWANIEGYRDVMNSPYTIPGLSDGGAHVKVITPAIYPTEVLSWLVRDTGRISLEEAHFRLSMMPV